MDTSGYLKATLLPDGMVLVTGGAVADLYSSASGTWTPTNAPSIHRYEHTTTLLPSGKVLFAGGYGNNSFYPNADLFDPATGTWTATGPLAVERFQHTATLLPNGDVLVAGGGNGSFIPTSLSSTELYHPAAGTWTTTKPLNTARRDHTATLLANGKALVAGGLINGNIRVASAELYDPAIGAWTATSPLNTARNAHTATLLPNGKVLVAGGLNYPVSLSSAELYDPDSGTWTYTSPMTTNRNEHVAMLLPNGKVLVVGGDSTGGRLASAELYDPATSTWTAVGASSTARSQHTAALLPNGKVLVAAGVNNSGFLASAELYDIGLGFSVSWQPQIATVTSPLSLGGSLMLAAPGSGASRKARAAIHKTRPPIIPLVQLRSLESGQTTFLLATTGRPIPSPPRRCGRSRPAMRWRRCS